MTGKATQVHPESGANSITTEDLSPKPLGLLSGPCWSEPPLLQPSPPEQQRGPSNTPFRELALWLADEHERRLAQARRMPGSRGGSPRIGRKIPTPPEGKMGLQLSNRALTPTPRSIRSNDKATAFREEEEVEGSTDDKTDVPALQRTSSIATLLDQEGREAKMESQKLFEAVVHEREMSLPGLLAETLVDQLNIRNFSNTGNSFTSVNKDVHLNSKTSVGFQGTSTLNRKMCEVDTNPGLDFEEEGHKLRPEWASLFTTVELRRGAANMQSMSFFAGGAGRLQLEEFDEGSVPQELYTGRFAWLISYPNNPKRMAWDLIGAMLIVFDMIWIPLRVFEPPENGATQAAEWFTLIFWTANVCATLSVGYVSNGVIIMVPRKILCNYLKGWFWLDLIIVTPDWVFQIMAEANDDVSAGSSVRLLRGLRLVRALRILRLVKLQRLLTIVNDLLDSEYAAIIANIFKMIAILVAINHFFACAWYGLTDLGFEHTWKKYHGMENDGWVYLYWTSFHWSITQFTPASMHIQPQNLVERIFAVLVVIFALVGFSYLVGSITGSLTQLRGMQEEYSKQFWLLRRYMKKHNIPLVLNFRIQRYLEHAWHQQKANASFTNLKLLAMLSEQLNSELQCTMFLPHLVVHPVFSYLKKLGNQDGTDFTLQRIATKAISRQPFARGDQLFMTGEVTRCMHVIVSGKLQYAKNNSHRRDYASAGEDWIAEPALWYTQWVHLGNAIAVIEADMMQIDADNFAKNVTLNMPVFSDLRRYAGRFAEWFDEVPEDERSDLYHGSMLAEEFECFLPRVDVKPQKHTPYFSSASGSG